MTKKNTEKQKITVVVNGRFHAFDYAAKLYKKNLLQRMISSMPYSVAKKYGIERKAYIGLPIFEVLKRSWRILLKKNSLYSFITQYSFAPLLNLFQN